MKRDAINNNGGEEYLGQILSSWRRILCAILACCSLSIKSADKRRISGDLSLYSLRKFLKIDGEEERWTAEWRKIVMARDSRIFSSSTMNAKTTTNAM